MFKIKNVLLAFVLVFCSSILHPESKTENPSISYEQERLFVKAIEENNVVLVEKMLNKYDINLNEYYIFHPDDYFKRAYRKPLDYLIGKLTYKVQENKGSDLTLIKLLIDRGACVLYSLADAVKTRSYKLVKFLVENTNVLINYTFGGRETPLYVAVEEGYEDIVALLLEHGAVLCTAGHPTYKRIGSALVRAAECNKTQMVELLLKNNKKANSYPEFQQEKDEALFMAARKDNLEMVCILLEHGAAVNYREKFSGCKAIHYAAGNGNVKMVALLIEHGASPDDRVSFKKKEKNNRWGDDIPAMVILSIPFRILSALFEAEPPYKNGSTAFDIACQKGRGSVKFYFKYYKDIDRKGLFTRLAFRLLM